MWFILTENSVNKYTYWSVSKYVYLLGTIYFYCISISTLTYKLMDDGWKYIKYRMRHYDETFLQEILCETFMRHFDETFWRDILTRHFDETFWRQSWMAFEKLWWPVMTFDMVLILMGRPYYSFDCVL